jgi:phage shock protein PspC (stress-responsive transcriptional regulator)
MALSEQSMRDRGLIRPRGDRWIAGVCSGLGLRFGVPAWKVRLLFVLLIVLPGSSVLAYLILWLLMPSETAPLSG